MQTQKFSRRPFDIDAVKVASDNLEEVAAWCGGTVEEFEDKKYIKVQVHRPLTERQTRAFIGDWVLFAGRGYKVYTEIAFNKNFVPAAAPVRSTPAGNPLTLEGELVIPKPGPPAATGLQFQ